MYKYIYLDVLLLRITTYIIMEESIWLIQRNISQISFCIDANLLIHMYYSL